MKVEKVILNKKLGTSLDLYLSVSNAPLPGIVIIPGGGYSTINDKDSERVALKFATNAFQAFVVHYPIKDKKSYAAAFETVSQVFEFIQKRAQSLNLDLEKLGTIGFSAGGQLAADYANQKESKVKFTLLGYPVITAALDENLGIKSRDVTRSVNSQTPPTFIFGSIKDKIAPYNEHIGPYTAALAANKVSFELHEFSTGNHGVSLANKYVQAVDKSSYDPHMAQWFPLALEWLKTQKG
ncbi:alpha/beta hydrolase [Liquorilactobacillus oeni]|uniref:Lipase esterase n=1 Tax=Liquorilactobacillus oeni DSM 19972 TaxID=1423777 RepID=A0A0R1MC24_9LACO|nr:alpha/beta hydrolase [Liquorilactobacillus oeni]KRL05821.1 lipase esterase [Liquorilactobacillus oeni DSM 19972]